MESKKYSPLDLPQFYNSVFKFRNDVTEYPAVWSGLSGQDPSHLATPFTGAHRPRDFSLQLLVLMAQTDGDMDRLARLLERNGQSALALGADLRFEES